MKSGHILIGILQWVGMNIQNSGIELRVKTSDRYSVKLVYLFKQVFSSPAKRAFPVFWQIFEPGTHWNLSLSITFGRTVDIPAVHRLALPQLISH